MKKQCFVDIETSGLKTDKGAVILSIGAVVSKAGKGAEPEFYALVTPTEAQWKLATPEALKVNGITWEYLVENGKPLVDVAYDFITWLTKNGVAKGKAEIVGQSPSFDLGFLRYFMDAELSFIGYPFEDVVDVRDLYSIMVNRGILPVLKKKDGNSISRALDVQEEPWPHNALEGARVVQRNYDKLIELMNKDKPAI